MLKTNQTYFAWDKDCLRNKFLFIPLLEIENQPSDKINLITTLYWNSGSFIISFSIIEIMPLPSDDGKFIPQGTKDKQFE